MVRSTTDDRFAEEYTESRRDVDLADLYVADFSGLTVEGDATGRQTAFDFDYTTSHGNTKTVRCLQGTKASERDVDKGATAECVTFWDNGTNWAVDLEDGAVFKKGDDHAFRKVADDVDVTLVDLPEAAPVVGAVQEDVDVTVHYRSKRSGNMKEMRLTDVRVDWEGDRVVGTDTRRDRRVEATACFERSVVTKGRREEEVGKCARIEFPTGHRFTVDVEGVTDDRVGGVEADIERVLSNRFDDYDVDVTHEGRIDD